jgi:vitamin B12 transporter
VRHLRLRYYPSHPVSSVVRVALCLACSAGIAGPTLAQSSGETLPEIVISAERGPSPLERTGSAISVINGATIAATNPLSLVDALRTVPGIDITESGGPGATANVRMRGANTGQTLVLIDGVRANDPSGATGDYDFAMFAPGAIERIEVLRGPQSALYGSDAIGGVINIITRKGGGPPRQDIAVEGGSYGTASVIGATSGSQGPWSYSATGAHQLSDGFSRYGYRIPAIEARFPWLENDGFRRSAGSARVGYDSGDGFRFDAGGLTSFTRAGLDAATGTFPDTPSLADRWYSQVNARGQLDTFDGRWTHSLNTFANRNDRHFDETTYSATGRPTRLITDFIGDRVGSEYQSTFKAGVLGSLTYGAKVEHEMANTFSTNVQPIPSGKRATLAATQDTRSVFALWHLPIGERLDLTAGGRSDDVADVKRFDTWRTTAAYRITETGTKLRASAGTGAKAPTLFQLYSPQNGTPTLVPEESFGYDVGIDQMLFNGRVNVSVTGFENSFKQLIEFDNSALGSSPTAQHYINVARAETSGLEVAGDVEVLPGYFRIRAAYTNLRAKDLNTNLTLARRPQHLAKLSFAITPLPEWLIEPRVTFVSKRYNSSGERGVLDPYARVDIYTEYRFLPGWKGFVRAENVLNERYQEVLNFGTTGPAVYAGLTGTW